MPVVRLTEEITATSRTSPEEAMKQALSKAESEVDGVTKAEVERVELVLRAGDVVGYRVTLKVTHAGGGAARAQNAAPTAGASPGIGARPLPRPSARGLLRTDEDGAARVGGTRIALDTVITAFRAETSPEEIAERYPSLGLADVYRVLGYYLQHREAVDGYLAEREDEAERLRERIEAEFDPVGLRARLLARRAADR